MLDVRRLSVLVTILDSGSLTAAAKTLGYSTSALSQQLQRLEQEVGQPLVRRQPRGVVATEAGALLAGHARYILRRLRAAESELGELAGLRRGRIAVGTFPTVGSTLMPIAVSRFRRDYPQVRLDVQSARFDELVASLLENTIGLSLLWDYEWNRIDEPDLSVTPLFEDPTVLVVSQDHRLGRARHAAMSMLGTTNGSFANATTRSPRCWSAARAQPGSRRRSPSRRTTIRRHSRWSASDSASLWPLGPLCSPRGPT